MGPRRVSAPAPDNERVGLSMPRHSITRYPFTCLYCSRPFVARIRNRKFCCRACFDAWSTAQQIATFWHRVLIGDGCWEWQGRICRATGYGQLGVAGKKVYAHRLAYELVYGV